jgi:predicted dehydrogenase
MANARLEFANGCVANLSVSRLGRESVRKIRVFSEHHYVSLDSGSGTLYIADKPSREQVEAVENPLDALKGEVKKYEKADALLDEIVQFIQSVQTKSRPEITAEEGRDALEVCTQVLHAIKENERKRGH